MASGSVDTRPDAAGTVASYRLQEAAPGGVVAPAEGLTTRRDILLMATENPMGRGRVDPDSPAGEDRKTERAVLALLLDEHPTRLTLADVRLALESTDPEREFAATDAVDRAVRELVAVGLLYRHGPFVAPTRVALYFEQLEAD